ncbi:hypothetical protein [Streptomyces sp. NPDC059063]|uniref:hypothetical protein n=1 Tax=unclassified Streptomyces TaxID=2593676 RepID=UPI0036B16979
MTHSTARRRRTATLLAAAASLAVGLAASPANAAATWESLTVPENIVDMTLLPFDSQNAYARTQLQCMNLCRAVPPKLWQKSGSTWKQLKPPTEVAFDTLAGTGPNDLWAIGRKDIGNRVWHVHHYDGTKWSADLSPDTTKVEILDAEAVSKNSLWGVGNTRNADFNPMITHWDGAKWDTKTFTDIKGSFESVDVRSENDIWAVGYGSVSEQAADYQPLAMHYDGTKWSKVPLPATPGDGNSVLREVFSNGPNDVWASSWVDVWHWNGTTWTRQDLPTPGWAMSFAGHGGQVYAGVQPQGSSGAKLVRWNGTSWEAADSALTNVRTVNQLANTPDGAMYALYQNYSYENFLSRLAPPTAR